jgi:hypothetical protein
MEVGDSAINTVRRKWLMCAQIIACWIASAEVLLAMKHRLDAVSEMRLIQTSKLFMLQCNLTF